MSAPNGLIGIAWSIIVGVNLIPIYLEYGLIPTIIALAGFIAATYVIYYFWKRWTRE